MLGMLDSECGYPRLKGHGRIQNYQWMSVSLLGPNLEQLCKAGGRKGLSLETVVDIGQQILKRIQTLHEYGYLHRDIKPENFLVGQKYTESKRKVYMIDLGLAKSYIIDNKHVPYREKKGLVGTARYVSVNTHLGLEQSRRDDLEAVGYLLMYLLKAQLPWQHI